MKRILITGENSYIGTKVEEWLNHEPDKYQVETLDMKNASWAEADFSVYDSVYHVAGIAHADISNVSEEVKQKYYEVNCNLAVETAKKAKRAGVKQFIYMSSLLVYGDSGNGTYRDRRYIDNSTEPHPTNFYGDSKWQAELKLSKMDCEDFHVVLVRPPMVYGPGCKGNYNGLRKIALLSLFFPDFNNHRSVLFVGNLCEFIRIIIEQNGRGVYWPQNSEYVKTSDFVREIAACHNRMIFVWRGLNFLVPFGSVIPGKIKRMINKAFGSLVVDLNLSQSDIGNYQIYSFKESIRITEEDR